MKKEGNRWIQRKVQFKKSTLVRFINTETGAHLAGGGGVQGVRTPAFFCYNPNYALKFLDQFRRNVLKKQFKKRKNPSKRCTKSILLKFFNITFRRISVVLTSKINLFSLIFYRTENNLSSFSAIISENKKKTFCF